MFQGDRMWAFALSIFLIGLTPVSFRLVAILGMAVSLSVVAFGPLVGDWIDATPRLKGNIIIITKVQNSVRKTYIICSVLESVTADNFKKYKTKQISNRTVISQTQYSS